LPDIYNLWIGISKTRAFCLIVQPWLMLIETVDDKDGVRADAILIHFIDPENKVRE